MVGIVTYNWAYLLAFLVFAVGLVYLLGTAIFALMWLIDPSVDTRLKDRAFTGVALMATAFVIVALFGEVHGGGLFSDAASSVSNAPGP